jgi:biopolymer transport protein ExbD
MKLKRKAQANAKIDVGSFSDIAFLLIIFFILTTTFVKIAGNKIEIPSGSSEESEVEQKQIAVTLSAESILYGESAKSISIDELRVALAKEKFETKEPDARMVVLETGGEVLYERYFQVVMAINDSGGVLTLIDHADGKDEDE